MTQIQRTELRDIIVRAAVAANVSDSDLSRLVTLARETKRLAIGNYACKGVGCPLLQAGLDYMGNHSRRRFAYNFDDAMRRAGFTDSFVDVIE